MSTSVQENYLKALYALHKKDQQIAVSDLSQRLGVSKPTANNMIKHLQELGYVLYEKYKPVRLSEEGIKAGALIVRKHRLTELFLHEIMGFGWEEVHEIAEQVEHINSERFFERMDEMLNHPTTDPHGSPIPDAKGNIPERQVQNFTTIPAGQKVRLLGLANSTTLLLEHLNQCGIRLGSLLEIKHVEPFDKSCLLICDENKTLTLSEKVCKSLLVSTEFKD